jgi:hypothetical protein
MSRTSDVATVSFMPIVPDDKDWTWVLEQVCPDCGFEAASIDKTEVHDLLRRNIGLWPPLLARSDATLRPSDDQWSALEYGCHVRDVFRLYHYRLKLMMNEDAPHFVNWDQDVTAIEDRYDQQDPDVVSGELVAAGLELADLFESVARDQWSRTGFRSDGAAFTIDTFARYFLHDPVHHVDDIERGYDVLAAGSID